MQVSSNKEPLRRFALVVMALGLMVLALAASSAQAETAAETASKAAVPPVPAAGGSVAEEAVADVAAEATPEPAPVSVPAKAVPVKAQTPAPPTSGETTKEAPSTAAADVVSAASRSLPVSSDSVPASSQAPPSAGEGAPPTRSVQGVLSATRSGAAELTESVRQGSTEAGAQLLERVKQAPASSALAQADQVGRTVSGAIAKLPSASKLLPQASGFEGGVLQAAPSAQPILQLTAVSTEVSGPIGALTDRPASSLGLALPLAARAPGSPVAPVAPALTPPAATPIPLSGKSAHLPGTPLAGAQETGVAGPRVMHFAGTVGEGPARLGLPALSESPHGALLAPLANGGHPDGALRHLEERSPPQAPISPPAFPEAVAAGSSGSIFVPIVALLALLALVAPAITRRLREAPVFRAPTPFLCALERPG